MLASGGTLQPYGSILFVIALAVGMAIAILILTHLVGPKRKGPRKNDTYESGMPPIGDARRRINVRFYIVALLFLLFDVEVVILWPWALAYYEAATTGATVAIPGAMVGKGFFLGGAGMFIGLLLVGYVYEWKKGVFRWD